jgi:hypothetical protein
MAAEPHADNAIIPPQATPSLVLGRAANLQLVPVTGNVLCLPLLRLLLALLHLLLVLLGGQLQDDGCHVVRHA